MKSTRLGQAITPVVKAIRAHALRLCVVCGERKDWPLFQPKRKRRALNLYCNQCGKENPEGVRAALSPQPLPVVNEENLRAAFEALRRRVELWIKQGKEVKGMNDETGMTPEQYATKALKALDRICSILGKTYAEMGDASELPDDQALMMIRDTALDVDRTLIERNKKKRLSRAKRDNP